MIFRRGDLGGKAGGERLGIKTQKTVATDYIIVYKIIQ
jgi:hypothetical protein